MGIQGLRTSLGFIGGADGDGERPLNWRAGILQRFPNGQAPLTALTAAMRTRVTDDPYFNWWEREVSARRMTLNANLDGAPGTGYGVTIVAGNGFDVLGGLQAVAGMVLRVEQTGELLLVDSDSNSDTAITVTRSFGGVAATSVTIATSGVNPNLLIVGTTYEEGAGTPESIRYRPQKFTNYTQIFRTSLKVTRTAMKTRLRTVPEVQDAKREALQYHSVDMEWGFLFGEQLEDTGPLGHPRRMTDGIIQMITNGASANVVDLATSADFATAYTTTMEEFEDQMLSMFRYGSQEKVCFCGNRAMLAMQRMARKNSSFDISPATKEFGMNIRRFFSPFGTLVLKTHPLFNNNQSGVNTTAWWSMDTWMLVIDMDDLTYRPLVDSDTKYLPNRQDNGTDGMTSEYLTEAGLELNHAKNHYLLKGVVFGDVDA